jgi:pyrroloquinoline quinone biosynthesis protein D
MSADPQKGPDTAEGHAPISGASIPAVDRRFRLQWEAAQNAHVLLYPEGMIKLNTSAGEILKRCDGQATLADITASLEQSFAASALSADVIAFIALAVDKKWVTLRS